MLVPLLLLFAATGASKAAITLPLSLADTSLSPSDGLAHILSLSHAVELKYRPHGDGESGVAVERRASSTVSLTNVYSDATYLASIKIGSASQPALSVILDTGSADLWVADSECQACTGSDYLLKIGAGSGITPQTKGFQIAYGSGTASGSLATASVSLGSFTLPDQTFGLVNSTSSSLIFSPISGILGLGFQRLAQSGAVPFWEQLASSSGSLDSPVMGFHLGRQAGGEFTLGGVDESMLAGKGDINYVSLDSNSGGREYWRIPLDAAVVGGESISFSSKGAAIDTGTTLILGPQAEVSKIYDKIGAESLGGGTWGFPCNQDVQVSFVFGGVAYALAKSDMSRGTTTSKTDPSKTLCVGTITAGDLGSAPMQWIVGAAFLKNVYSAFRSDPAAVGFVALTPAWAGSPATSSSTAAAGTTTSGSTGSSSVSDTASRPSSSGTPSSSSSDATSSASTSSASVSASAPSSSSSTAPGQTGGIVTSFVGPGIASPQSTAGAEASSNIKSGADASVRLGFGGVGMLLVGVMGIGGLL